MSPDAIKRLFPNASASTLAANAEGSELSSEAKGRQDQDAQLHPAAKRVVRNAALGKGKAQDGHSGRFLIRVQSVRKRLADEDGLCAKYVVDCCRYAGLIPDDAPGVCKIETTQRKAAKGEEEHTLIEIYAPNE